MRRYTFRTTVALATAASIAACSDAGGPSAGGQVNFNLATRPASAPTAAVHGASFAWTFAADAIPSSLGRTGRTMDSACGNKSRPPGGTLTDTDTFSTHPL